MRELDQGRHVRITLPSDLVVVDDNEFTKARVAEDN